MIPRTPITGFYETKPFAPRPHSPEFHGPNGLKPDGTALWGRFRGSGRLNDFNGLQAIPRPERPERPEIQTYARARVMKG